MINVVNEVGELLEFDHSTQTAKEPPEVVLARCPCHTFPGRDWVCLSCGRDGLVFLREQLRGSCSGSRAGRPCAGRRQLRAGPAAPADSGM